MRIHPLVKFATFPAVALSLLLSSVAHAQSLNLTQPSYTHVSAGGGENSRGYRSYNVDVEYEFAHKFFATGNYQHVRQNFNNDSTFRESVIDVGLGRYFNVYDRTTLDVSASLGNLTQSSNPFSTSNNNTFYTLNGGLRQRYDALEYRLGYRYIDMDNVGQNHGMVASAHIYFTPQTALGVYFNDVYSNSNWSIGMRFLF
ncbi:MAG: hypothetical protein JJU03_03215 [Idiomarina sp.]|nr:hypothetical protein [Idiomarina sp.]